MHEYPVGICRNRLGCEYQEPHRHGFACDRVCSCDGVGAETRPLSPGALRFCDWGGGCNRPTVAERLERVGDRWLPVCSWHGGWDELP
jgi:hypothetical protein